MDAHGRVPVPTERRRRAAAGTERADAGAEALAGAVGNRAFAGLVRESADGRLSRDPTLALRDRDERRVRDHGDDEGPSGRDEAPGKEGKLVRWHVQF